jgi:uncharacterized protein (TIGR03663 family)
MNKKFFGAAFFVILILAGLFRGINLDRRPMHHDEANQAVKFGALLEDGNYHYDPVDHHGPSLYYLSLPIAWISAGSSFAAVSEKTIRTVPVLFGISLISLFLLFGGGLSAEAKLSAAAMAAFSPLMVYYSRFYIQEMLLAAFLTGFLAALWRYIRKPSPGWALVSGLFAGLMYTTKETSLILFFSLAGALILTSLMEKKGDLRLKLRLSHTVIFAFTAFFLAALLYSSFFRNPQGLLDALLSFRSYIDKASAPGWHIHPMSYYLKMLTFWKLGSGPAWSEILVIGLAVLGSIFSIKGKTRPAAHPFLARFLCFFTLISAFIYSAIPYKTPWNAIPFYVGFLLLAGLGAAFLLNRRLSKPLIGLIIVLLTAGIFHLGLQSRRGITTYDADPRNPHVYAHTSKDFLNLVDRLKDIVPFHPEGQDMMIKVFAGPYETWPLPWYLRGYSRVGYWSDAEKAKDLTEVPIIIASMEFLEKIHPQIETSHISEFYGLRPEVLISLYIRKDLWEAFLETRKTP